MKESLMKIGIVFIWTSLIGLVVGLSILTITTCFSVAKWIILKIFSIFL